MYRRKYFLTAGAGLVGLLAGCTGEDDEGDEEEEDTGGNGDATAEEDEEEAPEEEGSEAEFVDQADDQVELVYGDAAQLSNGVAVTVRGIEVHEELGGEVPEEREAFALAEMEAVNNSDSEARLPQATDPALELLYEDQQVGPTFRSIVFSNSDYEGYEGASVQPGVRREGYILYEVGSGLSESDIDFLWQDEIFVAEGLEGAINVRWTADE